MKQNPNDEFATVITWLSIGILIGFTLAAMVIPYVP